MSRLKDLLDGGGDSGLLSSGGVVAVVLVVTVGVVLAVGVRSGEASRSLAVGTYTGRAFIVGMLVRLVSVLVNTSDLGLKVLQRDSGQDGVLVNNRSIVDLLVDGDGGVNVGVLDGLLQKSKGRVLAQVDRKRHDTRCRLTLLMTGWMVSWTWWWTCSLATAGAATTVDEEDDGKLRKRPS